MSEPYLNGTQQQIRAAISPYTPVNHSGSGYALSKLTRGLCPQCDEPLEPDEPEVGGIWICGLCPCCLALWEAELHEVGKVIVLRTPNGFSKCLCEPVSA